MLFTFTGSSETLISDAFVSNAENESIEKQRDKTKTKDKIFLKLFIEGFLSI
jgi:hypothetical protein